MPAAYLDRRKNVRISSISGGPFSSAAKCHPRERPARDRDHDIAHAERIRERLEREGLTIGFSDPFE